MSLTIENFKAYGTAEALAISGFPMIKDGRVNLSAGTNDIKRGKLLGTTKQGSGHDCFLKGIMVQAVITAPEYFWKQWERYSFQDTISSTSTMHKILEMNLDNAFSDDVDEGVIEVLKTLVEEYKSTKDESIYNKIIATLPMGFLYTKGISTNMLQLKTMYYQRKKHKLKEWRDFCEFLEGIWEFKTFVLGEK